MKLTKKQEAFCHAMLKCSNASDAYRMAYDVSKMKPESVNRCANTLMNNIKIISRIEQLRKPAVEKTKATYENVLREMARLAFLDARKFFDSDGNPIPVHLLDDDTAAAISGFDVVTIGNAEHGLGEVTKIKLADKNSALEKLAKHLGLYERDNKQKTDPMRELLQALSGKVIGVQDDE